MTRTRILDATAIRRVRNLQPKVSVIRLKADPNCPNRESCFPVLIFLSIAFAIWREVLGKVVA